MKKPEELLQERLERMEAGESPQACLADLPQDEAELLKLTVMLGKAQFPERDRKVIAVQRAELLALTRREGRIKVRSSRKGKRGPVHFRLNWLRPRIAFAGVAAFLFICALVVIVGSKVVRRSSPGTRVAQSPGAELTLPLQHTLFFPVVSIPDKRDPKSVALTEMRGLVQVQGSDGAWGAASVGHTLVAGQRVRTGQLSSARLAFYDGSQVYLGPDTEISVEELDARLSDGPRVVVLVQSSGETTHDVVSTTSDGSRYEVRTPSGAGEARGTSFRVLVAPDHSARFSVDEGVVAVTGQNVTVSVLAGQATTVEAGQAPSEPVFRITGEGEVTQTGDTWVIAGQVFQTHDDTVIVGNPQVGDWVLVKGRLLPDDTRVADWIVLLRRLPENHFTITGRVDDLGDTEWTVAGQTIAVNDETVIDDDVEINDLVRVEGIILQAGTLLAKRIRLVEEEPGLPFNFVGIVQEIGDDAWTVSGVAIAVDQVTEIGEDLVVGDVVQVSGWILDDGIWLARSIQRIEEQERRFEFTGSVESIAPWVVASIPFATDEWTEIETDIDIGDQVRVKGRILEDGTWLATAIERLDDDDAVLRIVFVGTVVSTDPWVVNGIPLVVDDDTVVNGDIDVGDLVRVEVEILLDGTWRAVKITLISDDESGLGCLSITAVVVSVDSGWIELLNWPVLFLDDDTIIEGEITEGSVIVIRLCVDADGTIHIVSITVIYQPEPVVPLPPPPPPPPPGGGKVTICHKPNSKNPHTITISRSALPAHLRQGDTLGPCP